MDDHAWGPPAADGVGKVIIDRYFPERKQLYAEAHPRRSEVLRSITSGLVAGGAWGAFQWDRGESLFPGVFFAVVIVLAVAVVVNFPTKSRHRERQLTAPEPLPPDTDPARLRAAKRLVRRGVPGADPMTNDLATRLARRRADEAETRGAGRFDTLLSTVISLSVVGGMAYLMVTQIDGGHFVAAGSVGAFALLLVLVVVGIPLRKRRNRKAAEFLDTLALEESR